MKGDETAIPFATSLIIVLIVAFVALMIVTGGQISLLFSAEALKGLFEPNKFTACVSDGEKCILGQRVSEQNVVLDCSSLFTRKATINIEKVQFFYCDPSEQRLGQRFQFLVAADYKNKLYIGSRGGEKVFECEYKDNPQHCPGEYECPVFSSKNPLQFNIEGVDSGDTILLHITMWKYEEDIQRRIENDISLSFSKLLDEAYPQYMTSLDIPIKSLKVDTATCNKNIPFSEIRDCFTCTELGYIWCSKLRDDTSMGVCVRDDPSVDPRVQCGSDFFWRIPKGFCR
jgi:hypothetical protein